MSCCILCAQDDGPKNVKINSANNSEEIRFFCEQLNIFQNTFLIQSSVEIPFCSDCHDIFVRIGRIHKTLEELKSIKLRVKGHFDKNISNGIRDKVTQLPDGQQQQSFGERHVTLFRNGLVQWASEKSTSPSSILEESLPNPKPEVIDLVDSESENEEAAEDPFSAFAITPTVSVASPRTVNRPVYESSAPKSTHLAVPGPPSNRYISQAPKSTSTSKILESLPKIPTTKFPCQLCNNKIKFNNVETFELHVARCHKTAVMVYHCSYPDCTETLSTNALLQTHLRKHQNVPEVSRLQCPHCLNQWYSSRKHLNRHVQNKHRSETKGHYRCKFCNYSNALAVNIRRHEIGQHKDELVHSCDECGRKYTSSALLVAHTSTHAEAGPYPCSMCNTIVNFRVELESHLIDTHIAVSHQEYTPPEFPDVYTHECSICNQLFETALQLRKHTAAAHEERKSHTCESCQQIFKDYNSLLKHVVMKHEIDNEKEKRKCPKCMKTYVTDFMMNRHIKHHRLDRVKPLACEICDCRFHKEDTEGLKRHVQIAHSNKPYACPYKCSAKGCDKRFQKIPLLRIHENMCHPELFIFGCTRCKAKYSSPAFLATHVNTHAVNNAQEPFNCTVCSKQFTTTLALTNHLHKHTGEKRNACPKCSAIFHKPKGLQSHINRVHKKKYLCRPCGRDLMNQSHLTMHLESANHRAKVARGPKKEPEKKSCPQCPMEFRNRNHLKYHISMKHQPRVLEMCRICDKLVFRLNRHMSNVHHKSSFVNAKNYVCYFCNKSYSRHCSLQMHVATHTNERPYSCKICKIEFAYQTSFIRHRRVAHGSKKKTLNLDVKVEEPLIKVEQQENNEVVTNSDFTEFLTQNNILID